ncbi:dihydrolipoyl dehydrogenase [Marivirga sp. S37H4]|uniref:Dihydrolipoyl dehydrogenase n=1 Tax=Marivirga aurantiaca TaxID=2802615 RepID=A0A935C9G8_9BACT|nr:dihydrolipoyl dehydrogenase [Marivirga aurantiaca]MBK6265587.1 dihydrolipoyl dehydrogenase [Marivirga aurantiaca]
MTKEDKKELVIIGAGPGGYGAAFRAADLGLKVTLIDPEVNPGGVCLYRGCIPTKALLYVVNTMHEAERASEYGLAYDKPDVDVGKMIKWKNKVVSKLTKGLGQLTKNRNIEYIRGTAKFKSEEKLTVATHDGEELTLGFKNVILATGSSPMELPNIKIDHDVIIDSTDLLERNQIPESMLVIGGGYIGLELGSVYAALDCKVSVAEMTSNFLPGTDTDLIEVFKKENKELFDAVYFETTVEEISVKDGKAVVNFKNGEGNQQKEYDKVLVAVGRKPSSDKLNLEGIGVKTDENGYLLVDDQRRTSVGNVYAIGDLTGDPLLAHKATHEGRLVAEVIAGESGATYAPKAIPGVVFTHPEMAWCGLSEIQAEERGREVKVAKYPWSASGRATAIGATNGLTKLIFDPETGRILGGAVAGKGAGKLIAEIALAIEMASTAEDLALTIHPHPTLSETIMESAEMFLGGATHYSPS